MPIPKELKSYATSIGFPSSETLARIFEILYDEEDDLKIMKALNKPNTASELAKKTGLSEARIKERAEKLMKKGALTHVSKQPHIYRRFPAMIEIRDASCLNPDASQELFELWDQLVQKEISVLIPFIKEFNIPPVVRVIPIEETVEAQNTVLDADSVRKIFKEAKLISVIPCVCRTVALKNGRGQDCPAPKEAVCMQTNAFAQAILNRDIGEKITNEDALRRIELAEKAGLVHMARNNIKEDMFVCNCCSCCCSGMFIVQQGYSKAIAPSRFQVKLNAEACQGCGTCVDRCQFGAITLDGTAIIDLDKCFGCGNCVLTCPEEALKLVEIHPLSHIRVK
ncbi:MAG: 4Fe-4S dicluster domain-containing protein [Candidatus Lokiarchaeota archaeon]|nr:4Fe-4S dicluster domain-containing protein [Candidatus Lokiarchaeota archaeon]